MAVLKHISVKGSNGGDALDYVMYKHNEMTGEIITDGQGNPIMRDEFYLDGINCEPYSFAAECREVNELYGKNQKMEDVKAHHFIISYDPKDAADHDLTGPKAQQISLEFAERCLPGFQMLICTHMDGSNESGNIHTHIMMNSVRKYDTDPESFGEREIDHKAGYKLHLTDDYLRFMKQELMSICEREGLYQVDLLSPAEERITDREYRVHQHGQDRLDKMNERKAHDGLETNKSMFQTQKQYLREAVEKVTPRATNFDEFCEIMKKEYNITVKESRGRISYLHPDREKFITGRALGSVYEKDAVLKEITINHTLNNMENNPVDQELIIPKSPKTIEDCQRVFIMRTDLHLVVRLQNCAKAKENTACASKVALSNVKAMAETILFVQQNGFDSVDALEKEYEKIELECREISKQILEKKEEQKEVNETIHYLGQYLSHKNEYQNYSRSRNKNEYNTHEGELAKYTMAVNYLKQRFADRPFPALLRLKEEKRHIEENLEKYQNQVTDIKEKNEKLQIVIHNVKVMLGEDNSKMKARYDKPLKIELSEKRKEKDSR